VKRCAIYARYSSDLQSRTSIEDQHQLCRADAKRQGWAVVSVFEDAALSGFGIERLPGYQQLIAAALSSPAAFEVVLVEDLSRLTRDMAELLRVTTRLRLKGGELVGVSDGIAPASRARRCTSPSKASSTSSTSTISATRPTEGCRDLWLEV
jgi:site-specific DNA recombinase